MKKKENIIKSKLTEEELASIRGGAGTIWVCDQAMPSYVKKKPRSSVYYAWMWGHCYQAQYCPPTTWNVCY